MKLLLKFGLVMFFSLLAFIFVVILYEVYNAHFSSKAQRAAKNLENCRRVKNNMKKDSVFKIMGLPDTIISFRNSEGGNTTYYCYEENDDSHPFIEIEIDTNSKVQGVYAPIYK